MEPKKNKAYDLERNYRLHLTIGLILSIAFVTVAFEWRTEVPVVDLPPREVIEAPVLSPIPNTVHEPPKPKVVLPTIVPVEDDVEIEEDIDFVIDVQLSDKEIENFLFVDEPTEKPDSIHVTAETQPSFPGGINAFYQYVAENVNYPKPAIRQGVSGKVFVQFVVDKDGSLSDLKVIKSIGAGCDQEALRVVRNAPHWNPGKQRGKPVRVRMVVPITFRLQ